MLKWLLYGVLGIVGLFVVLIIIAIITLLPAEEQGPTPQREHPQAKQEPRDKSSRGGGESKQPSTDAQKPQRVNYPEPVRGLAISRVVDGDTIELSRPVDGTDTVRLIGIDAPEEESGECGAQPLATDATTHLATWEGAEIRLEFDQAKTDPYDRLLAYVRDDLTGEMLNKRMVADGYAQVWIIPPNDRYANELRRAQQEARELSLGFGLDIWSLKPSEEKLLADHGNGIGKGDGGCRPKPHTASPSASASASSSASPEPNPSPNRERGGGNRGNKAPSSASPAPEGVCPQGGHWVGLYGPGDGDGCAGE